MEYSCFDFRPFGVAKSLCTPEDFVHFVDEFDFASFADFMPTCAKDVVEGLFAQQEYRYHSINIMN